MQASEAGQQCRFCPVWCMQGWVGVCGHTCLTRVCVSLHTHNIHIQHIHNTYATNTHAQESKHTKLAKQLHNTLCGIIPYHGTTIRRSMSQSPPHNHLLPRCHQPLHRGSQLQCLCQAHRCTCIVRDNNCVLCARVCVCGRCILLLMGCAAHTVYSLLPFCVPPNSIAISLFAILSLFGFLYGAHCTLTTVTVCPGAFAIVATHMARPSAKSMLRIGSRLPCD